MIHLNYHFHGDEFSQSFSEDDAEGKEIFRIFKEIFQRDIPEESLILLSIEHKFAALPEMEPVELNQTQLEKIETVLEAVFPYDKLHFTLLKLDFLPEQIEELLDIYTDQPQLERLAKAGYTYEELIFLSNLSETQAAELLHIENEPTKYPPEFYKVQSRELIQYYHDEENLQTLYIKHLGKASEVGAKLIEKGWDFRTILDYLAAKRRKMASVALNDEPELFGKKRAINFNTNCKGVYEPLKQPLTEFRTKLIEHFNANKEHPEFLEAGEENSYYFVSNDFKLSKILFKKLQGDIEIQHTDPDLIEPILDYVEELYKQALLEKNPMELSGQIFWWICQAKPWHRGDPSIAEMLVRALLISKGFKPVPWKEGIVPWMETMKEPDVKKFGKNFYKLMPAN